jgi:hypothetical protein
MLIIPNLKKTKDEGRKKTKDEGRFLQKRGK